jgi:hypothetical protein
VVIGARTRMLRVFPRPLAVNEPTGVRAARPLQCVLVSAYKPKVRALVRALRRYYSCYSNYLSVVEIVIYEKGPELRW